MLAAPLMIGCDIRNMDETTKSILMNKDIIAIDQDPVGKQGFRVYRHDGLEAFKKPLSGDRVAIAFLNRNSTIKKIIVSNKELELDPEAKFAVYDVWKHTESKQIPGFLSANLKPHECQVYVLTPNGQK